MFIDLLYHPLVTVMAADLVRAARSENDCEPERLRLDNYKMKMSRYLFTVQNNVFLLACSKS
jgi:hypothetical protein